MFTPDNLKKLLNRNLPIVQLAGDNYLLTVPPLDYWRQLQQAHAAEIPITERTSRTIVFREEENGVQYVLADRSIEGSGMFRHIATYSREITAEGVTKGLVWEDITYLDAMLEFRLMLIPLTAEGALDTAFQENNPDGLIFHGGYLQFSFPEHERSPYITVTLYEQMHPDTAPYITGADSLRLVEDRPSSRKTDQELAWRSWNGCLVSTGTMFRMTLYCANRMNLLLH